MRNRDRVVLTVVAMAVCVFCWADQATARVQPSFFDLVLEGGAVQPLGDLDASFDTPSGFEATTGYNLGVRFRQRFVSGWSISPSFHYVHFGKYLGEHELGSFETGASMFRYGVDLQYFFPGPRNSSRFFLSGGAALVNNRMHEEYLWDDSEFKDNMNSLAMAAGAGMQVGNFEFLAQYHFNRFDTGRFFEGTQDYKWDYISLQVGVALPSTYSGRR